MSEDKEVVVVDDTEPVNMVDVKITVDGVEQYNENIFLCPDSNEARCEMTTWGKKKRQRYCHLIEVEKQSRDKAFAAIKFNKGEVIE